MIKRLPLTISGVLSLNVLLLVLLLVVTVDMQAQSVFMADLNERENTEEFEFSNLVGVNGKTYVIVRGRELWASYLAENDEDVIVKLGGYDTVTNLTVVGSRIYFAARTVEKGLELY